MTRPADFLHRAAFSFMELVVVLLIAGIMTAAAVPTFFDSLMVHRVESAARRIKLDLELTRRDAMAHSTSRSFDFVSTNTYQMPGVASLRRANQTYSVDLAASPYHASVTTVSFSGLDNFAFTGHGLPTSGGTITLQAGNHIREITVDGASGAVSITTP